MEKAPLVRIKSIATMQRTAVVPNHDIAKAPFLRPCKPWLCDMCKQLVEQRIAFGLI